MILDTLYPLFLTVHLICAIIFLGFIFTDVILLSVIKKYFSEEIVNKFFYAISSRGVKIMPLCLFLLVITGGAMITHYIGIEKGFFDTALQQLLMLKVLFAILIVIMVIISLSFRFFIKRRNPLAKIIHPLALIFGFFIVLCAKFAFYV